MIRIRHFAEEASMSIFIEGKESIERFQELIQRGAGTWADATAEIKTAADLITSGVEMQPYSQMSSEKK